MPEPELPTPQMGSSIDVQNFPGDLGSMRQMSELQQLMSNHQKFASLPSQHFPCAYNVLQRICHNALQGTFLSEYAKYQLIRSENAID